MTTKREKLKKEIISGFCWFGFFLVLTVAYWWVMTNYLIHDFWDPQYVMKSTLLQTLVKKNPDRSLWLIMGSSRVDDGVRAGVLEDGTARPGAPLIFNFGFGGGNMFRQYSCLKRLLESGVKPQRIGIEVIGALLSRDAEMFADEPKLIVRARRDEIDELSTFAINARDTKAAWQQSRWNPFCKFGMQIPNQSLSLRLFPFPGLRHLEKEPYDPWGWYAMPAGITPAPAYYKGLIEAKEEYASCFDPPFKVAPRFDRLMHLTLDMCRKAGIEVFLFKMPEDADFQASYTPEATAVIDAYLGKIEGEYGIKMIDGRNWVTDREDFMDGHHLNAAGGKIFTPKFVQALIDTAQPPAAH